MEISLWLCILALGPRKPLFKGFLITDHERELGLLTNWELLLIAYHPKKGNHMCPLTWSLHARVQAVVSCCGEHAQAYLVSTRQDNTFQYSPRGNVSTSPLSSCPGCFTQLTPYVLCDHNMVVNISLLPIWHQFRWFLDCLNYGRFTLWSKVERPWISTNHIARDQEFGISTLHTKVKVQRLSQFKMITFLRRGWTLEGSLGWMGMETKTMVERSSIFFHKIINRWQNLGG